MNIFGERLLETLKRNGISQYRLAQELGLTTRAVNLWVLGKREPDFDMLIRLARRLNTTTDYLLGVDKLNTGGKL
ncbi:MAG: helix-turn-helix domain-containing protein [Christensenellaceae bacterium]|nr:helix-turn-helix domain-containing protein [Christensenellaceae bacterium]